MPPPGVKPPILSVSDFAIRDLGRDEIRFALTLDAENPNDFDVPVTDLRFDLDLLGRPFASGNAKQRKLVLERNATRPLPIEFTVPTSRLVALRSGDLSLVELTALSYRLKGSARWGDGIFTIPFERRGELDALAQVPRRPAPAPGLLSALALGAAGAAAPRNASVDPVAWTRRPRERATRFL